MYDSQILTLYYNTLTPPITDEKVNYFNAGISRIVQGWAPSDTYVAADIWFLWSLFYHQAIPGTGNQSIHNAVFLDGHAASPGVRDVAGCRELGAACPRAIRSQERGRLARSGNVRS